MFTRIVCTLIALLAIGGAVSAQDLRQGVAVGYQEDISGLVTFDVENINGNIPFSFGIFVGYGYQFDSGNAEAARKIFINDNTGGTIQKFGTAIHLGADFRYALHQEGDFALRLFAGPRGVLYEAHYAYLGDNEDFDVRSNQGGAAGGLQALIPVNERFDISLSAGLAYYLPAKLEGHGEFLYSPNGVDDNPRNDYTWEDADGAVNQPGLSFPVYFGIRWKL